MKILKPATINRAINQVNDNFFDTKPMNKIYKYATEHPEAFASRMALVSALTKDAVGCYYYVKQSLENKKIPDDKRDFVAALDLMNGILNISLQLSVGLWIDNNYKKWFDGSIGKVLDKANTRKITKKIMPLINTDKNPEKVTFEQAEAFLRDKILGKSGKAATWLKVGFGAAVVLTATQVVTKRMIVPFISTPLATWYKDKFMVKKHKHGNKKDIPVQEPLVNKLSYNVSNLGQNRDVFNKFGTR